VKSAIPLLAAVLALPALEVRAQSGGKAELAVQGYYLRTGSQTSAGTTGAALNFEEFLPNAGLLRGNIEAYRSGGGIQPADNYLQLRGFVWHGLRWNVNAGDFRASGTLLRNPFSNLFFPEIDARGIAVDAGDSQRGYSFFYGTETILAGPRIPFRADVPQRVMGASVRQKFGRFETGVRILLLENTARDPSGGFSFPAGRDFRSAGNLTAYSTYTFNDHFRWYGEATAARAKSADGVPPGQPFSYFFGPAWESPRLTLRANYANLTRSYLPLAGYWVGDRKGPFGEFRIRPFRRVEFFGSANQYETASRAAAKLPFLGSSGTSAGMYIELPLKVNFSTQLSSANFHSSDPAGDRTQRSSNRQWTGTVSRGIGGHTLRFTVRDTRLAVNGVSSREKSVEAEDTFQIHHFVVGGGARVQQFAGQDRRKGIYAHGSAQFNLGRWSAFGFFEEGKDLANETVFATNTTNSAIVGANLRLTRRWSVQGEAFRSRLISQINPENLFVQGNLNLALSPVLSRFNQWSFLFRVARTFHWGAVLPPAGLDEFTVRRIPITGVVEGLVSVLTSSGRQPAPGVAVGLETGRSAITDAEGRYRLSEVPEGAHIVTIDMERLPADYNPGRQVTARVAIGPRRIARADFDVYSLSGFAGSVAVRPGSEFESLEGIPIRLEPGGQYTSTAKDGSFAFYNLPEGAYIVRIEEKALGPEARVTGDLALPVAVRTGTATPAVRFEIERQRPGDKPVRKVFENVVRARVSAPAEPPEGSLSPRASDPK
jgi:hypothetical protein